MQNLKKLQEYYTTIITSGKDNTEHVFDPVEQDFLEGLDEFKCINHGRKCTALDIGYGYGQYVREFLNRGYSVDAVDIISPEILRENIKNTDVNIYQCDINQFTDWRSYDIVIAKDILHFFSQDEAKKLLVDNKIHSKKHGLHYYHIFTDITRRDKEGQPKVFNGESQFSSKDLSSFLLDLYSGWHINLDFEGYKELSFDKKYVYFKATKVRFLAIK